MGSDEKTYHIAFAADDNYAPYLSVAIQSIKETRKAGVRCVIYVLTTGLTAENEAKLASMGDAALEMRFVDVSSKMKEAAGFGQYYLSISTYFRVYLAGLLPDLDRVLYLDCDLLVMRDLGELYNTDFGNAYVAACQDLAHRLRPDTEKRQMGRAILAKDGVYLEHYFNAGVILMNLAAIRRDGLESELIRLSTRKDLMWQDQDVFNIACKDRWVQLPAEWNYNLHVYNEKEVPRLPDDPKEAAIAHYVVYKPWDCYYSTLAAEWCRTALRTPFAEQIKAEMLSGKKRPGMLEIICLPLYRLLAHMPFLPKSLVNRARGKTRVVAGKLGFGPCLRIMKQ